MVIGLTPGKQQSKPLQKFSRAACRYGSACFQAGQEHSERFSHPGDLDYRQGLISFEEGQQPELPTLWHVFIFYDRRDSGHLSKEEFRLAALAVLAIASGSRPLDLEEAWEDAGGLEHGHVSFVRFAVWSVRATDQAEIPVGLEPEPAGSCARPCRACCEGGAGVTHAVVDGRCACTGYRNLAAVAGAAPTSDHCICGHRAHAHRSEAAQRSLAEQLLAGRPRHWDRGAGGLVRVHDAELLSQLQLLLDATHKESDNWTRDRGCLLHGVNGCEAKCIYQHKAPVPKGFRLVAAFRNQNPTLWARYRLMRATVVQECERYGKKRLNILSSTQPFHQLDAFPLVDHANEWRVFHGSSDANCRAICDRNFSLPLAGTGATWRKPGVDRGTPLYGHGLYFAERITKADEYATPETVDADDGTLCTVLLCRVLGGRSVLCQENEIDQAALKRQVLHGPHHSVLGDRMHALGKPYREVVLYDADQVYPELLLTYERIYR